MCRYEINADGRITFVDDEWCRFAVANGARQYADPAWLYGKPLLSFISDPTTRQLYALLMARVRASRSAVRVPLRCDAPALRRWLELEISPGADGGLTFASYELRTETRAPIPTFEAAAGGASALLRMCSWCKRVEAAAGHWQDIEDAIASLALFCAPS